MRDQHCSDERLLAHLDGESGYVDRWRTRTHLKSCWECRAKLIEIAEDTAELVRLGLVEKARWDERARAAKNDFLARVHRQAAEAPARSKWGQWWRVPASVAGGALVMVAGYTVWHGAAKLKVQPPSSTQVNRLQADPAPPAPLAAPQLRAAPRRELPAMAGMPLAITPGMLADAEVEAISVVRAYPSLGMTAFSFERDETRGLRITGVAEGDEQRNFLLSDFEAAVRSAPWTAAIQIPREAAPVVSAEPMQAVAVVSTRPAGQPLLLELLRSRMAPEEANAKANEISNNVIRHSSAAWSSAWTLKRLAQRFPDATVIQMSPRGRAALSHIVAAESSALRASLADARASIPLEGADPVNVKPVDCWPTVERADRLAHSLLASGASQPADPRRAMTELASLLEGLARLLEGGELVARFWPSLEIGEAAAAAQR